MNTEDKHPHPLDEHTCPGSASLKAECNRLYDRIQILVRDLDEAQKAYDEIRAERDVLRKRLSDLSIDPQGGSR